MNNAIVIDPPGFIQRVLSVFYRHYKCYFKHVVANGFPPFVEPLLFLAAIGFGVGRYVNTIEGMKYSEYVAPGLLASTAMFTATFELTYGTHIRMEYKRIYDGILSTPIGIVDAFVGEVIWAGAKGLFFSLAVLITISFFGLVHSPWALCAPAVGFLTGIIYGALGLIMTSFITEINNFNFYVTGCCTPMFFLAGIFMPVKELPVVLQKVSYCIPLTHSVNLMRGLVLGKLESFHVHNLLFLIIIIPPVVWFAIRCIKKRMII
ncbi:ABC transporter permease [bacterium]|nr:ABC transporter permease [bacterium]MCP5461860.1 ABC transporter permease [bacterium]